MNLGRRRGGGCITGRGGKPNGESEKQDMEIGVTRLRVRGQGKKRHFEMDGRHALHLQGQ